MTEMLLQKWLREQISGYATHGLFRDAVWSALAFKELEDVFAIKAKRHSVYPNLVLFKYNQIASDFNNPMVRECRGVILDENNGWAVVSRAFDKFGNHGEGYCPEIDWTTARVQEKIDGSLCVMYEYGGEWHVATSGTPDASGHLHGGEECFADYFWRVFGDRELPPLGFGDCFVFEITGPLNRVVVPHAEAKLTLLTVRNVKGFAAPTGEWTREHVEAFGDEWCDVVKEFPLQSIDDVLTTFDTLNPLHNEGYVIVDGNFNRIKVKHPGYVALHHAKDGMGPKAFLDIARRGETSEVTLAFPEFANSVLSAHAAIIDFTFQIEDAYESVLDIETQKEFAGTVLVKHKKISSALFALRNGKVTSARDWVNALPIDKLLEFLPPSEWL